MLKMKKIILLIVALGITGFIVHSYLKEKAIPKAAATAEKTQQQEVKSTISELVSRTQAIDDWESALAPDDGFRLSPVLTIELEKLWLRDRPILFLGVIQDIATLDDSKYNLIIFQTLFLSPENETSTPLILSLSADKSVIDSFLNAQPDLFLDQSDYNNGIAVVAKILRIRKGTDSDEEGIPLEVKIGEGVLIDIAFIGEGIF